MAWRVNRLVSRSRIFLGKLIFDVVLLSVFIRFLHSLVVARPHCTVLFTRPLSLEPPVNSDLLSVQAVLVACARLVMGEVDNICTVGSFGWFAKLDRPINFIWYPVLTFILNVKHFTRNFCGHGCISFCFEVDLSLLVDNLQGYSLNFATLRVE